jgi:hypothetical protein
MRIYKAKIDIIELEKVTQLAFDHCRNVGLDSVEVDEDFYWVVEQEYRYNPNKVPERAEMGLGQLSDEIDEIRRVASGEKDPTGFTLVRLAALLRFIGERYSA